MRIEHVDSGSVDEATILVEGLRQGVTLLQITDSHLTEVDARDPDVLAAGEERRTQFAASSPEGPGTSEHFHYALQRGKQIGADCIVLTGDIVDFPSFANLETVADGLAATALPYLYTLGNHDWHLPHLVWSDETRARFYPRFGGLTAGNPAYGTRDLGGVRLVAIDNSNYQVTPEQLAFLRTQLEAGMPCLLFIHVPLFVPSLAPAVVARWQAPIMMAADGWTAETQAAWRVRDADPSTQRCYDFLTAGAADNLAAVFCGHVHFAHAGPFREGRIQYVTRPGFEGGYRVIRLLPLDGRTS